MKGNRRVHPRGRPLVKVGVVCAIVVAVAVAVVFGCVRLHDLWLEQCVIVDMERQVSITSGRLVKQDVIAELFGLKPGANLARIDFSAKRARILCDHPSIRGISISRRLPDGVSISVEERKPVARLSYRNFTKNTGRVVDGEGVVFECVPGTSSLPTIREKSAPGTPCGARLTGSSLAALQLIDLCREPEFQSLGILDVSTGSPDFLRATLGSYATAKIAWEGMAEETHEARANLRRQLTHLVQAINSHVGNRIVTWDATDRSRHGRIYAR